MNMIKKGIINISLCFVLLILVLETIHAQEKVIKIKFTETNYMDKSINLPPNVMANMPKSRVVKKILFCSDSVSTFITDKEAMVEVNNNTMGGEERGRRGRFMNRGNINSVIYINLNQDVKLTYTDIFGKEFLIQEPAESNKWKLHSSEQRDILGLPCTKATWQKDSTMITAWFTTKVPLSVGPGGYNGLPGAILALTEGESKVYLATSIEEVEFDSNQLSSPTKGEKVSREQYNKIQIEKRKEMEEMWGNRMRN